jgi:hypothetical protein
MNPYLMALVQSRTTSYGNDPIGLGKVTADANTQPPRLYSTFASGGGILHNKDAATGLQASGFSIVGSQLDSAEAAYLRGINSAWEGKNYGWFFSCEGGMEKTGGNWTCRHSAPGEPAITVETMTTAEARQGDIVDRAELRPAAEIMGRMPSHVTVIGGGGDTGWTNEMFAGAVAAVQSWYSLGRGLERLHMAKKAGVVFPPSAEAVITHGYRTRARIAQPVSAFIGKYPQYKQSDNFGDDSIGVEAVTASLVWAGVTVFVALTAYAFMHKLSSEAPEIQAANNEVWLLNSAQTQALRDCVTDPSKGFFEKRVCTKALNVERGAIPQTEPTAQAIAGLAKNAMYIALVGAGVYMAGPFVRSAAQGMAERGKARRQRRTAEQQAGRQSERQQKRLSKQQALDVQFQLIEGDAA